MKNIILILILFSSLAFANRSSDTLRVEIIKKIVFGIENYDKISLYSDDKNIMKSFRNVESFNVASDAEEAKLIILNDIKNLPKAYKDKYIFVLDYNLLHEVPESFGAFFWKKGRPNIIFIRPRIQKYSLKLVGDLEPYIEDKVW